MAVADIKVTRTVATASVHMTAGLRPLLAAKRTSMRSCSRRALWRASMLASASFASSLQMVNQVQF